MNSEQKTIRELIEELISHWNYKYPKDIEKVFTDMIRREGKAFTRKVLESLVKQDINK